MMKTLLHLILVSFVLAAQLHSDESETQVAAEDGTSIHGYFNIDFQSGVLINDASEKNKLVNNLEVYRFILAVSSQLNDKIRFNSELEIEHATRAGVKTSSVTVDADGNSTTSSDKTSVLSSAGAGLEIELEQAWVEFAYWEAFTPRVGVILVPLGRLNLYHDSDIVETVDRPLVDQVIIPSTWYEPGLGLTGAKEFGEWRLSYEAYLINGLRGSVDSAANEGKLRDMRMSKDPNNDNNVNKAQVGRLVISPSTWLEFGFSGYRGNYDDADSLEARMGALDLRLKVWHLEFLGEWAEAYFQKPETYTKVFAGTRHGWYGQAMLDLGFLPWAHASRAALIYQLGQVDPDVSRATGNDQSRQVLGLTLRPIPNVAVKLNYVCTDYVLGYIDAGGGLSRVNDQRFAFSVAAAY